MLLVSRFQGFSTGFDGKINIKTVWSLKCTSNKNISTTIYGHLGPAKPASSGSKGKLNHMFKMHRRTLNIDPTLTCQHTVMKVAGHMLSSACFTLPLTVVALTFYPALKIPPCSSQSSRIVFFTFVHLKLRPERLSLRGAHLRTCTPQTWPE